MPVETYVTLAMLVALPATVALLVMSWVASHIGWTRTVAAIAGAALALLAWATGLHWLIEWSDNLTF